MKISFKIHYHTVSGECLFISGNLPSLGNNDIETAVPMVCTENDFWEYSMEIETNKTLEYKYLVKNINDKSLRIEWGVPHSIKIPSQIKNINIRDYWQDNPLDKPFYSTAFSKGIFRRNNEKRLPYKTNTCRIEVFAPEIRPDQQLAISGNIKELGNWDTKKAVKMNGAQFPLWVANLKFSNKEKDIQYKFIVIDKKSGQIISWENSENRQVDFLYPEKESISIISGIRWQDSLPPWKGAGTAIPVFSLRSSGSFGIGDFADIRLMVDWCAVTGQNILQLLPINDTTITGTWLDSYPYKANSTFALHPMYIRLEEVGKIKNKGRMQYYKKIATELNALTEVDYERVNDAKTNYLREIFLQDGEKTLSSTEYKNFFKKNSKWLLPYAAWRVLRDKFNTADNTKWGQFAHYQEKIIKNFIKENLQEINLHCFIQYHLTKQLHITCEYAHSKGVVLKGDIPIGISRLSVDAWLYPFLFNMNSQAGAPPDDFSILGQNWGFPTYNWEEMSKDGFGWWKDRFKKMSEYFDAYRIDHILGFFRIWQISINQIHGLLGIFNPALPYSIEELRNSYGFDLNVSIHTNPLINERILRDVFGELKKSIVLQFLEKNKNGNYRLKDFINTQKKINQYFQNHPKTEQNKLVIDGLTKLIDDVLFIEDPIKKGKYHPRITAQFTYQYRLLSDYEKQCFDRLYNDFFYYRNNELWKEKALWKLPPLIDSTGMLACAEDLGMIPQCVPYVMEELRILSLEIQRMPKESNREFGDTWSYPYFSVCTTSTHDMSGIRAWWEEDHDRSQRFFNKILHQSGEAPYFAEPWICDKILQLQLDSPSILCIIPLQDWLSFDGDLRRKMPSEEQINEPANPNHYWRYRMHISIEELMRQTSFNNALLMKIKKSGR